MLVCHKVAFILSLKYICCVEKYLVEGLRKVGKECCSSGAADQNGKR